MAKTARDAYRDARVLAEFFHDVVTVGADELEKFLERQEKRRYLRKSIQRLVARGFLRKEGATLAPTARGHALFRRYITPPSPNMTPISQGKWHFISFDIPVKRTTARVALTRLLRARGFIPFQRSVWAGPHQLAADVWEFIVDHDLAAFCAPMIVEIVEGGDSLKRRFARARAHRNH